MLGNGLEEGILSRQLFSEEILRRLCDAFDEFIKNAVDLMTSFISFGTTASAQRDHSSSEKLLKIAAP